MLDPDTINQDNFNDGILVNVNTSDDEFSEDEADRPLDRNPGRKVQPADIEEIPPEVIEKLKANPALNRYFGKLINAGVDARLKSMERQPRKDGKINNSEGCQSYSSGKFTIRNHNL